MRKRPSQERSQQMVETLIEATARAVTKYGLDGVTTPKIAEIAGVSVGSLYQYFDDKQALIEALLEQKTREMIERLQQLIIGLDSDDLAHIVHESILFGFSLFRQEDGLYLEIARNWHRLPIQKMIDTMQNYSLDFGRIYFLKFYQKYPIENLHVRFFIIVNSTLFTMTQHLNAPQSMIKEQEIVEGLTQMVVGYLQMGNPVKPA